MVRLKGFGVNLVLIAFLNFNSTMVRLKAFIVSTETVINRHFNSTMVRLKVRKADIINPVAIYISIPRWYD